MKHGVKHIHDNVYDHANCGNRSDTIARCISFTRFHFRGKRKKPEVVRFDNAVSVLISAVWRSCGMSYAASTKSRSLLPASK